MTSFAAWVGVDQRGPASIYLTSDSRISWAGKSVITWDFGKKLFASRASPDILGYVGDVLFPSLVLGQITAAIDAGVLFSPTASPSERYYRIRESIDKTFANLPSSEKRHFTIVYATREGDGMGCQFHLWALTWSPSTGWKSEYVELPIRSSAIRIYGSGEAEFRKWQQRWDASSQGGTSRAVFSAFCDSVASGKDLFSGGAPQLVGMYRKNNAKPFGIVYKGSSYLYGLPINPEDAAIAEEFEWRNHLFERCDIRGRLLENAQKHHAPKGLGATNESAAHSGGNAKRKPRT